MMLDYRGQIAEATGANIFFTKHGVIHTPTPDCFLNGIIRQTVIDPVSEIGPYRFAPSTISETPMNDYMKEVYPAAIAAG